MNRVVWDTFCRVATAERNKAAVIDARSGELLSYREMLAKATQYADILAKRSEKIVAYLGEPSLTALPLLLACAASDRCFVPLSDREPIGQIRETLSALPDQTLLASPHLSLNQSSEMSLNELSNIESNWEVIKGEQPLSEFLPFIVTHSSGSTGKPKPIAFSQKTKLRRTLQSANLFNVSRDDVILCPTPLHHSLGQRHFFLSMLTGATLVKAYPFSPELWIHAAKTYSVSFAIPVSTHLKILQSSFLDNPTLLAGFRCLVTSSALAEPEFKRMILDRFDFDFWEIYGMSETACATAVQYKKGSDTQYLGLAISGSKVRISGGDHQQDGEIEVLSDCLCDGYWGDPDRWSNALTSDGYFRSGDLGRLDSDGNLIFLGRTNESFESGGLIIYPAEIERVISELPQLANCVAFGLPDKVFGNLIGLSYTANSELSEREVILHARSKLPKHMWPSKIFRTESFPCLPSGKIDRYAVVQESINNFNQRL